MKKYPGKTSFGLLLQSVLDNARAMRSPLFITRQRIQPGVKFLISYLMSVHRYTSLIVSNVWATALEPFCPH